MKSGVLSIAIKNIFGPFGTAHDYYQQKTDINFKDL